MNKPEEVLSDLVKRFRPEAAKGISAVYELRVTGEAAGTWHLTIADQQCAVSPGRAEHPDITIAISDEDWANLVAGKLDPVNAYLSGRIVVSGDFSLAPMLQQLFGW